MRSGGLISAVALVAILGAGFPTALRSNAAVPSEGVSDARFARLARGINLSHWFAQSPRGDYSAEHLTTYNTERDLDLIARMGFSHVRLTCNEFGVYRKVSPPEARLRWIRDVRTALQTHHIGWAMWDYAGGFSVVVQEGGRRVPDPATLVALGLQSAE